MIDEIGVRLDTIAGLKVSPYGLAGSIATPGAAIYAPNRIAFDSTYGRGSDAYEDMIVVIFIAMRDRRSAFKELTPYLAGSGAKSIKAIVDAAASNAPYASAADVRVEWAEVDEMSIGGTEYVAGLFHINVFGKGA